MSEKHELAISNMVYPEIKWNYEEIKSYLERNLEKYQQLIINAETLGDAKKMQKELSRIRRDIDAKRLEVKNDIMKPIKDFEDQMKSLFELVVKVENPIKESISVFTEKEKAEKRENIEIYIENEISESGLSDRYKSMVVFNDKWLNKTATIKSIQEDIDVLIGTAQNKQKLDEQNIKVIKQTIEAQNKIHNLSYPLDEKSHISMVIDNGMELSTVIERIIDDAERQAKVEKAKAEKDQQQKTYIVPEQPKQEKSSDNAAKTTPKTRTVVISVTSTDEKLRRLRAFLVENGIPFEKVS